MTKPEFYSINIFGGPGSGKSTLAAGVYTLLKMHHIEIELIPEYPKDLVYEERFKTLENQLYVWAKQFQRMYRTKDQVDGIITDSPLAMCLAYCNNWKIDLEKQIMDSHRLFKDMNFYVNRSKHYTGVGRYQTQDEAIEKDKDILKVMNDHGIVYTCVDCDMYGINSVARLILEKIYKTPYMEVFLDEPLYP